MMFPPERVVVMVTDDGPTVLKLRPLVLPADSICATCSGVSACLQIPISSRMAVPVSGERNVGSCPMTTGTGLPTSILPIKAMLVLAASTPSRYVLATLALRSTVTTKLCQLPSLIKGTVPLGLRPLVPSFILHSQPPVL